MKHLQMVTGIVFAGFIIMLAAVPATAGPGGPEQVFKAAPTGRSESNPIQMTEGYHRRAHGLQMVLKNVTPTGVNPYCRFEVYDTYGRFLWRGPSFSQDWTMSWDHYFITRDGNRYYKDEKDPKWTLEGIKIKASITDATADMTFYLLY